MKKFVKGLAVLGVMASLCSCASKTDYATFKTKASEALKLESPYTKATVKGSYESDGKKVSINMKFVYETKASIGSLAAKAWTTESSGAEAIALTIVLNSSIATYAASDEGNENATYYAGSTFKVVIESDGNKAEYKFNKYGQYTSINDSTGKYTISYTK